MIGRRDLLKLTAGAGVAAFGMASRGLVLPWINTGRAAEGAELIEPEVRTSQDGLLDTTIEASVMPVPVAGGTAIMAVYDGTIPGPTLRVRPGDTAAHQAGQQAGRLPAGLPADNPFQWTPLGGPVTGVTTRPPATRTSTRTDSTSPHPTTPTTPFSPSWPARASSTSSRSRADHPSGVYHYHPHVHGASHQQIFGGMAGSIIIEGEIDRLPGIEGVTERLLVLQTTQFTPDGCSVIAQEDASQKDYVRLVNGQLNPTITIKPGETQRWRVQNLTPSTTFRLRLDDHQLHQIAKDGNTLDETWTHESIVLGPGERTEMLVQGGPRAATRCGRCRSPPGSPPRPAKVLATLVSAGAAMTPEPLPTTLLPFPGRSFDPLSRRDRREPPDHLPDQAADQSAGRYCPDRQQDLRRQSRRSGRSPQHD